MKAPIPFALAAALAAAACSDATPDENGQGGGDTTTTATTTTTTTGGGSGGQSATTCDDEDGCDACQGCTFSEGGDCVDVLDLCLDNQDCVDLNECMTACVGDDPMKFSGCLDECNQAHPQGESDYADVLDCVAGACPSNCQF